MHSRLAVALGATALLSSFFAADAAAQASFTPVYHSPYRVAGSHEFGAALSFPDGADVGLEGHYRFGSGSYDVGLRAGFIDYTGGSTFVLAVDGRWRVIDHTEVNFPLDGSVIVGVGTAEFDNWIVPAAGLSLGRRVVLEDFEFVAYGQPTLFVYTGTGDTNIDFGFGFGIDFMVGQSLELRTSVGTFDGPEGVAFSLAWIR